MTGAGAAQMAASPSDHSLGGGDDRMVGFAQEAVVRQRLGERVKYDAFLAFTVQTRSPQRAKPAFPIMQVYDRLPSQ